MPDGETKVDMVNHPPHYGNGPDDPYEHIKIMEATLTREEFVGAMKFTISRYWHRLDKKGDPLENAQKAQWYTNRLVEYMQRPKTDQRWFRDVGRQRIEVTEEMRMEALRHLHEVPTPLGSGESITLLGVPLQSMETGGQWHWGIDRSGRAGPGGHRS